MARGPFPEVVVLAMAFGSVVLLMSTGVRWGVNRKVRTSFNGAEFIEDSLAGGAWALRRVRAVHAVRPVRSACIQQL
jgi:hypothetical protein